MFWKRKKEISGLGFQHYVPLRLSENLPGIFKQKAKENNYADIYKTYIQLLVSETFIIAGMIGCCRPDIITGIYKQNEKNHEKLMKVTRNGLNQMIDAMKKRGEFSLTSFASSFKRPEIYVLPKGNSGKEIPIEIISILGIPFLFGYTFGHDYPKLFFELLEKRLQELIKKEPNTIVVIGFLSIYSSLIEDVDRSLLLDIVRYSNDHLPNEEKVIHQKIISIYQEIAIKLAEEYEQTVGFPE